MKKISSATEKARERSKRLEGYTYALSEENSCENLYENHLAGDKWKKIITIDEAWIYLNDCIKQVKIKFKKSKHPTA